ncbi:MAG: hypothetical protein DRO67_10530 [Candidatus Asgardarchaeum californiense]|nr:MAG: hypothetical protein DRO67_10530 [Candidatus Asgardarchaeum californiense]
MKEDKDLDKFFQEQLIKNSMMDMFKNLSARLGGQADWPKLVDIAYKEYEVAIRIMNKLHEEMDSDGVFKTIDKQPEMKFFIYMLLLKLATLDVIIADFIKKRK